MLLSFYRIFKFAGQHFRRNLWFSLVTVTMLVLPLLTVNIIVGLGAIARAATNSIQDKVDVSVYFKSTVTNENAQAVRNMLLGLQEVKQVEFVPKEGVLERFKKRHASDPVILESIEEVSDNPFGATLSIKAKQIDDYQKILKIIEQPEYSQLIEEKNFEDHQVTIARINEIMKNVRTFSFFVAGIFGLIAILIIINSIRIAIYTHRDEVGIMRLVGAGDTFIRGPFLVKGFFLCCLAMVVTLLIVYPSLNFVQPYINNFFEGVDLNLVQYFNANFLSIFGSQFFGITFLSLFSTTIAIRRYLKV